LVVLLLEFPAGRELHDIFAPFSAMAGMPELPCAGKIRFDKGFSLAEPPDKPAPCR
jgi:hypothetical protein